MSFCCCRVVQYCAERLGVVELKEPEIPFEEAARRLRRMEWEPIDNRALFGRLTENTLYAANPLLKDSLNAMQKEGRPVGIAIDFACGSNHSTIDLLKHGYTVKAFDNSQSVIANLQKKVHASKEIAKERLQLTCEKMEDYVFPKNVELILMEQALPYCDPRKVVAVWDRAYHSLAVGGRIVGSFYAQSKSRFVQKLTYAAGAWTTDKSVVEALLRGRGYEIAVCKHSGDKAGLRRIDFVGIKTGF